MTVGSSLLEQAKLHPFWPRAHCHLYREKHQGAPKGTMAEAAAGRYSDDFHQDITQRLAELTTEDMYWLLGDPRTLDTVMERLGVDSEEAGALHYILEQELMRREGGDGPWGRLPQEERVFLLAFPWRKHKLEETIKELRAVADEADSAHKRLTETNLVAGSAGILSGALTLLTITLLPGTAAGNLLLSVAIQGMGAAAFVTNFVANVLEDKSKSAARDRASRLVAFPTTAEPEAGGGVSSSAAETTMEAAQRCYKVLGSVRGLSAYWAARANPGFMARVRNFVTARRAPFLRATGVQRASGQGPAPARTCGGQMQSAAGAGFSLMQDVKSFLRDWQHLCEGARTEVAADLRAQAEELEQELSQLSGRYQQIILQQSGSLEAGERVEQDCVARPLPEVERDCVARPLPETPGRDTETEADRFIRPSTHQTDF